MAGFLKGAAVFFVLLSGSVSGQTRPVELPPEGYAERSYVDSSGCVYARVGITAVLAWVPRMDADGKPVCGQQPTFASNATSALTNAPEELAAANAAVGTSPSGAAPPDERGTPPAPSPAPKRHAALVRKPPLVYLMGSEDLDMSATLCVGHLRKAHRYWISDGTRVTKCGPPAPDGVAFVNGLGVPGLILAGSQSSDSEFQMLLSRFDVPYRVSWSNGPLKAHSTQSNPALSVAPPANQPTQEAPAAGPRWVQVGAFAQTANADKAIATIRQLGLAPARQSLRKGALTAVLAGPFPTPLDAQKARALLVGAGYGDAFLR